MPSTPSGVEDWMVSKTNIPVHTELTFQWWNSQVNPSETHKTHFHGTDSLVMEVKHIPKI